MQVQIQRPRKLRTESEPAVGVDLGVRRLATLSNGERTDALQPLKHQLKGLRRLQRSLARMTQGGANWKKMKARIARKHYRIAGLRKNTLHQLTAYLARKYGHVAIEDLNVKGMVKNKHLARAINDVGFHEFRRQLGYKAEREGSRVTVIDRWAPSSKTCSCCGAYKQDLSRGDEVFKCEHCGLVLDRDLNAAINIAVLAEGNPSLPGDAEALVPPPMEVA